MKKRLATALLAASLLSGCYTISLNISDPEAEKGAQVLRYFKAESKVHHAVFALMTLNDPDVRKIVAEEVRRAGGREARNVRVTLQRSFIDQLIGGLTGQLYAPTSVTVEGEVIK